MEHRKGRIRLLLLSLLLVPGIVSAQADKRDVRAGNRKYARQQYKEAEIDYRKALLKDSLSLAAAYNLASTLYRQRDYAGASKLLEPARKRVDGHPAAADVHFNAGDIALQQQDYAAAVKAFRQALLLHPDDMDAKENYTYAKQMLKRQQEQQEQQGQDNQDQQQNQDQDQQDKDQQDQNQDQQDKDQQNPDQDRQDDRQQGQDQEQQAGISPQQAQQMLRAIQAKEQETQDKVKKEKAEALVSRQKEKNW